MKTLPTIALAGLLLLGCQQSDQSGSGTADTSSGNDESTTLVAFNPDGAPTREFTVDGMHCQYACVDKVKTVMKEQPGVKDVKVDFENKLVTVAVDDAVFQDQQAVASLEDHQFTAQPVEN